MRQPKSEPVYICSICGKDIAGIMCISKQGEEQSSISITGVCRAGKEKSYGEINTSPQ